MMMRIPIVVFALTLAATPLATQTAADVATPGDAPAAPPAASLPAPVLDPRLIVEPAEAPDTARPTESEEWQRVVTRPWWHYPAIGLAIGGAAGAIHSNAIMQGDPIGIPFDPRYVLPLAYGAGGAFLGILIDSAERERAARR
jgi:hypothetical protein